MIYPKIINNIIRRIDFIVLIPVLLFVILLLPFLGNLPCSDAGFDFSNAKEFYLHEGLAMFLTPPPKQFVKVYPMHPPLKYVLASVFFKIGGVNQYSYNLMGIFVGILGILSIYGLGKEIGNRNIGIISALLLAISPMYLSNGLHSLTDFMVTSFIITAFYFYSRSKMLGYTVFATAAVLTKETALILPLAVLCIEIIFSILKKGNYKKEPVYILYKNLFMASIPLLLYYVWLSFLKNHGIAEWSAFIFAETRNKGAFATVVHNILTLDIFNKYAQQHISWLLYLNFNWVYWLLALLGIMTLGMCYFNKLKKKLSQLPHLKVIVSMLLFVVGYIGTVLTFQTYAIPRYHLPVLPFLFLASAIFLQRFIIKHTLISIAAISIFILTSLYFSVDPISRIFWNKRIVFGQTFYDTEDDNMVYNLQFLRLTKNETCSYRSLL